MIRATILNKERAALCRRVIDMIQYEELRLALLEQEKPLKELYESLGIESVKEEIEKLEEQTASEGFWNDVAAANAVNTKLAGLKNRLKKYDDLKADYEDTLTLIEMCNEEEDDSSRTIYDELPDEVWRRD